MQDLLLLGRVLKTAPILFAAKAVGAQPTLIGSIVVVVVLVIALVVGWKNWQEAHDVEEPDSPEDLLSSFEEAHAAGELDDDEMRRVRERLQSTSPVPPPSGSRELGEARSEPRFPSDESAQEP